MTRGVAAALVAVALLALSACDDREVMPDELCGGWRWTGSSGGLAGGRVDPAADEPVRTLELSADGVVRFRLDGELIATRRVAWRTVDSVVHGAPRDAIVYLGENGAPPGIPELVELSDDGRRLTLTQNVADGFASVWERTDR